MAAAREYREAIARFAEMRNIDVWYTRLDVAAILKQLGASASRKQMKRFQTDVAKVHTKDSMRALAKLCRTVDGELRIVGNPPSSRRSRTYSQMLSRTTWRTLCGA